MYRYIYKIQFENGYYYIGKHKSTSLDDNYKGSGVKLSAFRKQYPHLNETKEILCLCDSAYELNERERDFIGDLYKTDKYCLNLCAGGYGGTDLNEETKKKMSVAHIGKTKSEETRKRMSENNAMHDQNNRKKISNALKGRTFSEETRKRMSDVKKGKPSWNKGKIGLYKHSEESKQKISEALKGRSSYIRTEENKKLQSEKHKGQIPWNTGLSKEQQPTFGKHWKLKFKRGWKLNHETGKREYFIV